VDDPEKREEYTLIVGFYPKLTRLAIQKFLYYKLDFTVNSRPQEAQE
jgi:hypothetical protein